MFHLIKTKAKVSHNASAVVTGAGSGIGQAFALEIVARGGQVVCADINIITAQQTADLINQTHQGKAFAVQCDVSLLHDVTRLADQAQNWLDKPINLVINNAGVGAGGQSIGQMPIEDWKWIVDINLWGVIHGCHVFTPILRQTGQGGMINVASTASFAAAPLMSAYNTTKAAVLALTETLAAELAGTNIQVTALCPTVVKTNIFDAARIDASLKNVWLDRLIRWTGFTAARVAKTTLDGLDVGKLYVLPQIDAKLIWGLKRFMPRTYTRGAGLLKRLAG